MPTDDYRVYSDGTRYRLQIACVFKELIKLGDFDKFPVNTAFWGVH